MNNCFKKVCILIMKQNYLIVYSSQIIFKSGVMGPAPTKQKLKPIFNVSQFQQIQVKQQNYRSQYGEYTSYENRISQQKIDKYQLQFKTKKQLQDYYECFLQRFREEYIVNTIQFIDLSHHQFCSSLFQAQVFIQHIPIRLSDITDIPYPDNIYILQNSLLGFRALYSKIGYFEVQETHICINSYGEVKVWMNSNLSKNYLEYCTEQLKSESDMVHQILHLIESNTNINQCPTQLGEYFVKKHNKYPNFTEALQLINLYITQHKTVIPKFCQSVFEVFQKSEQSKLKKQLTLYEHSQSSYHQKSERRNTIQVNDMFIPRLDLPNVQQSENLIPSLKKSEAMRDTVKILPSYPIYPTNHAKNTNQQFKSLLIQNTPRLSTHINRTIGYHSPQHNFTNYYNQLRTKRFPMPFNSTYQGTNPNNNILINDQFKAIHQMKQSMACSFLRASQLKNLPHVNFSYKSPETIFNLGHSIESKNNNLEKNIHEKWSNSKNKNNADAFFKEVSKKKNFKQETMELKKNSSPYFHATNISQVKKTDLKSDRQKQSLVYYDTGKGSQLIDPQIAADLIKYL